MMLNYEEMSIIEIFVKVSVCADSDELNNDGIFFTVCSIPFGPGSLGSFLTFYAKVVNLIEESFQLLASFKCNVSCCLNFSLLKDICFTIICPRSFWF